MCILAYSSLVGSFSLCNIADLYRIIEKSDCTAVDVERFSTTLNYLVAKCGYMLKAAKPSLLQRYTHVCAPFLLCVHTCDIPRSVAVNVFSSIRVQDIIIIIILK